MRIAAIDVGTNTVLLLIADVQPGGAIVPLLHAQRFPRLGQGIDAQGYISPDAIARLIEVLREYRILLAPHKPDRIVVCGTSAVRDALNQAELVRRVQTETGFTLEILSGEEEARWTFRGALSGLREIERATVIDIGGGSTEIITGAHGTIERSISLQVGSVRLKERHLLHDPPTHPDLEAAITEVEDALASVSDFPLAGSTLVGVAGTATSLALFFIPLFYVVILRIFRRKGSS